MAATPKREPTAGRDPLDLLAEDFARRCRRGERPTVEEYAVRFPALAGKIRQVLPAVAFLERGKGPEAFSGMNSGLGSRALELPTRHVPAVRQLGDNRVVGELGRGGMGIVYEAVQESLGRRVAVKILPRHAHGDANSRQRFLREARVVARLRHPNIVPIHAVGEQDGLPYYVMPLIDGGGLDRLLADPQSALPVAPADRARWVAKLGRQAADALAHAHGENVLHRDIKPANLLLDSSGTLWLADFGLAKLADDLSLTGTGELPGTLRYLAPECLRAAADARSDIYSLGLTLYELLVGRPAFLEADRVRLLRQIASSQVRAPRRIVPGLPRDIETIVLKAMAHAPASRYATAADLSADLQRFLDGRPIRARRVGLSERLIRSCRRNPAVAALAGTSLALGLVTAVLLRLHLLASPTLPPVALPSPAPPRAEAPKPVLSPSPPGRNDPPRTVVPEIELPLPPPLDLARPPGRDRPDGPHDHRPPPPPPRHGRPPDENPRPLDLPPEIP